MPNEFWEGLQRLLVVSNDCSPREMFLKSPHIANEYFVRRANSFFKVFFGKYGVERKWIWRRYEFQKRGNIHLHGMLRLNIDEDFPTLGEEVIKGRKAYHLLMWMKMNFDIDDSSLREKINLIDSLLYKDDVIDLDTLIQDKKPISSALFIEEQYRTYMDGLRAERKLINFRDFFLTTENGLGSLPQDATASTRDPPVKQDNKSNHPSSKFEDVMKQTDYCLRTWIP